MNNKAPGHSLSDLLDSKLQPIWEELIELNKNAAMTEVRFHLLTQQLNRLEVQLANSSRQALLDDSKQACP